MLLVTPLSSTMRSSVVCRQVDGDGPEVTRLKRMGICVGRRLEIVHAGDPMILCVAGTRVGLSRKLAACVLVEPVTQLFESERGESKDREGGPS
ncbi:MAG: ferrous iron transport protein A [Planctomycetaceae bacterium]